MPYNVHVCAIPSHGYNTHFVNFSQSLLSYMTPVLICVHVACGSQGMIFTCSAFAATNSAGLSTAHVYIDLLQI